MKFLNKENKMDNLKSLKPLKPTFSINETTSYIEVSVELKPRDKKRRLVTQISDEDIKLYVETTGLSMGNLIERPDGVFNNRSNETKKVGVWKFSKKDLRVKSTPPKGSQRYAKSTPPKGGSRKTTTKTSSKKG
tara:strand:+ start:946 stop:1347 length:402 start_codon:yes stop_codon:yes gene_type:complete